MWWVDLLAGHNAVEVKYYFGNLYPNVVFCTKPSDGGSKHLWNIGKLLPDYTVQYPRRHSSALNLF
jgi:hypothetical protein